MIALLESLFRRGPRRHKDWHKAKIAHLKANPECAACGSTSRLIVHHIRPFQWFPHLELVEANLLTLCEGETLNCHLWLGHCGNFAKWYNPNVLDDASRFRWMLAHRQGDPAEKIPLKPNEGSGAGGAALTNDGG